MTDIRPNDKYVDIREIRMERALEWPPEKHNEGYDCFLTLGHFSWTYVKQLKSSIGNTGIDPELIRNLYLNETPQYPAYTQSTFLLREFENLNPIYDFWDPDANMKRGTNFMMISRAHGVAFRTKEDNVITREKTEAGVEDKIDQLSIEETIELALGHSVSDGGKMDEQHPYIYEYYRTADLVDVVIVIKACSIQNLLIAVSRLYSAEGVGDIYSYCCIQPGLLTGQINVNTVPDDALSLLSIRFAVKESFQCGQMLELLKGAWTGLHPNKNATLRADFVTGTDDINVIFRNVSTRDVCRLYRQLLQKDSNLFLTLLDAVEDMTTRLGIDAYEYIYKNGIPERTKDKISDSDLLYEFYSLQQTRLKKLEEQQEEKEEQETKGEKKEPEQFPREEVRILMRIIHSLVSISKNSVVHQLCYILAEPIQGVVDRLTHQRPGWDYEDLDEFLAGFAYLMEHIIRMEGSLVPHPETRPLLFDIPASILEFDLAFTNRCARYLTDREKDPARSSCTIYRFLLVPCLCRNITIHDRFNERNNAQDQLLYVNIPLSLIYKPLDVACSLIHEVAHHSGEISRKRKERAVHLRLCAAFLIAAEFDMDNSVQVVDLLYDQISILVPEEKRQYLEDFCPAINDCIGSIVGQQYYIEELLQRYIAEKRPADSDGFYTRGMQRCEDLIRNNKVGDLIHSMDQIEMLFSECYADLVMVSLLNLPVDQYIGLFTGDFIQMKESYIREDEAGKDEIAITFSVLMERIGLVICAMRDMKKWLNFNLPKTELAGYVDSYLNEFTKEHGRRRSDRFQCPAWFTVSRKDRFHPFYALDTIRVYLGDCLDLMLDMDGKTEENDEIKHIRKLFKMFAKDRQLSSVDFFKEISDHRKKVLLSISNKLNGLN